MKPEHVLIRRDFFELLGDAISAALLSYLCSETEKALIADKVYGPTMDRMREEGLEVGISRLDGWISMSLAEAADAIILCASSTAGKRLRELEDKGYVESRESQHSWDRTKQYRVCLGALQDDLEELGYELRGFGAEDVYTEENESPDEDESPDEAPEHTPPAVRATQVKVGGARKGVDDKDKDLSVRDQERIAEMERWRKGMGPHVFTPDLVEKEIREKETRQSQVGYCGWMLTSLFGDGHSLSDVFGRCMKLANDIESHSGQAGEGPLLLGQTLLEMAKPPPPGSQRADFRPWQNEKRRSSLPNNVLNYITAALNNRRSHNVTKREESATEAERINEESERELEEILGE